MSVKKNFDTKIFCEIITTYLTMQKIPTSVTELEIIIPKDKLNDLKFIYLKLMEVSLDTLVQIANHSDKNVLELVQEFIPELKNLDNDEFLSKWNLSKLILNGGNVPSPQTDNIVNVVDEITMAPTMVVNDITTPPVLVNDTPKAPVLPKKNKKLINKIILKKTSKKVLKPIKLKKSSATKESLPVVTKVTIPKVDIEDNITPVVKIYLKKPKKKKLKIGIQKIKLPK